MAHEAHSKRGHSKYSAMPVSVRGIHLELFDLVAPLQPGYRASDVQGGDVSQEMRRVNHWRFSALVSVVWHRGDPVCALVQSPGEPVIGHMGGSTRENSAHNSPSTCIWIVRVCTSACLKKLNHGYWGEAVDIKGCMGRTLTWSMRHRCSSRAARGIVDWQGKLRPSTGQLHSSRVNHH